MIVFYLILAAAIACGVAVAVNPRIAWRLKALQYRDPEANYPSTLWFAGQRVGGVVIAAVSIAVWATLWEPAPPPEAEVQPEAAATPSPQQEEAADLGSGWKTLTDASAPQGRISGYELLAEDRIQVHAWLGHCYSGTNPLVVSVEEDTDTVIVSAGYRAHDIYCIEGEQVGGMADATVDLDEDLGDRTVVDIAGEPLVSYGTDE